MACFESQAPPGFKRACATETAHRSGWGLTTATSGPQDAAQPCAPPWLLRAPPSRIVGEFRVAGPAIEEAQLTPALDGETHDLDGRRGGPATRTATPTATAPSSHDIPFIAAARARQSKTPPFPIWAQAQMRPHEPGNHRVGQNHASHGIGDQHRDILEVDEHQEQRRCDGQTRPARSPTSGSRRSAPPAFP